MEVPDNLPWEVLVVNNNCTDHTDAVIASFAGRLPIRRRLEPGVPRSLAGMPAESRGRCGRRGLHCLDRRRCCRRHRDSCLLRGVEPLAAQAAFSAVPSPRYAPPVPKWFSESEALLRNSVSEGAISATKRCRCWPAALLFGPSCGPRCGTAPLPVQSQLGHAPGRGEGGEELDVLDRMYSPVRADTGFRPRGWSIAAMQASKLSATSRATSRPLVKPARFWRRVREASAVVRCAALDVAFNSSKNGSAIKSSNSFRPRLSGFGICVIMPTLGVRSATIGEVHGSKSVRWEAESANCTGDANSAIDAFAEPLIFLPYYAKSVIIECRSGSFCDLSRQTIYLIDKY